MNTPEEESKEIETTANGSANASHENNFPFREATDSVTNLMIGLRPELCGPKLGLMVYSYSLSAIGLSGNKKLNCRNRHSDMAHHYVPDVVA